MILFEGDKKAIKGSIRKTKEIILQIAKDHQKQIDSLVYIFMDDESLLKINRKALNHDYYTDIISFDYSFGEFLEGEIYISIDRVRENAITFHEEFHVELLRVMIHGVLHMCGYKDKNKTQKINMRALENRYLLLYKKLFHVEPNRNGKRI